MSWCGSSWFKGHCPLDMRSALTWSVKYPIFWSNFASLMLSFGPSSGARGNSYTSERPAACCSTRSAPETPKLKSKSVPQREHTFPLESTDKHWYSCVSPKIQRWLRIIVPSENTQTSHYGPTGIKTTLICSTFSKRLLIGDALKIETTHPSLWRSAFGWLCITQPQANLYSPVMPSALRKEQSLMVSASEVSRISHGDGKNLGCECSLPPTGMNIWTYLFGKRNSSSKTQSL